MLKAATLVDLDATQLPNGPLATWPNAGSIAGEFTATGGPAVGAVDGINAVTLNGTTQFYTGPAAPLEVTGNGSRTVEAWILNPTIADEETVFSWGRRGGPEGSNCSFNHGLNGAFGAVGHWGSPDIGWNDQITAGSWTYVVYTYDGPNQTTIVYRDGVEANSEVLPAPLNTHATSDTGAPLPFRVASQNEANGAATAALRGSMSIARIRVHDSALDASAIAAKFEQEKAFFGLIDSDSDGLPDWYERRYSTILNPNDATDAVKDQDADTLTTLREFEVGTNPTKADTDGDGVSDADELNRMAGGVAAPTDPLRPDTDADGLSDKVETGTGVFVNANNTGSDPLVSDTDGDSFGDQQEVFAGSDPNNPNSVPGAARPALVKLDATSLAAGPIPTWMNEGTIGGEFAAPANGIPSVEPFAGVNGIVFNSTGTAQYMTGPATPSFITGNASRTVEAWIWNPAAADEETIFSWGRRGGPDGSNCSFNHGLNATFGAVGHWGAPDLGWNGQVEVGRWTYVVYTYDSAAQIAIVYKDGVQANDELISSLNTHAVDNQNRPLPFRIASQNEANGNATGGLRGTMTIARLRVYDRVLDPDTILSTYNSEAGGFGLIDFDNDGIPTWYERLFTFLNPNDPSDAAKDQDNDGLSNLGEYQAGTKPDVQDTDGDGVLDGAEVNRLVGGNPAPTNPLRPDTDQDGLTDKVETGTGTFVNANDTGSDPLVADTDADTWLDGQEVFHGSNPNSLSSVPVFGAPVALVHLDATKLTPGPLPVWNNTGVMGGAFVGREGFLANVETVGDVNGVTFGGTHFFTGPAAPLFITGNGSRSVDAWIFNPALNTEETVFAWGRRGGPDGSNASFIHGSNATFGAMGLWGAGPDVSWGGAANIVVGEWTHVAYVYDGATSTATVYKNGVQANTETFAAPLVTWAVDNTPAMNPLPFRVGAQNNANGGAGGQFASLTMARLRAYDQPLTSEQIANIYNSELATLARPKLSAKIEQTGGVTLTWTPAPGQTYALEISEDLSQWSNLATGLATGSYTDQIPADKRVRFYRLRAE
ncbi:MAG: LamG-like jellyroll fold domain-containing protein [Verrucomicrobiota bacterium]